MTTAEKTQYNPIATAYATISDLPLSQIEYQLIASALGDCTGLTILDLGGGSGVHARRAVELGAALVDVVDISSEMLRIGEEIEAKLSRKDRIRWFAADASKPLSSHLGDSATYDIVMANWVFDHATSVQDLEGMWTNVATHLKPGGRFLGVRVKNPRAEYLAKGKYGVTFTGLEEIEGGVKYTVGCLTEPPFGFEATSMEETLVMSDEIGKRMGLVEFATVDPREMEVVKKDEEFWGEFVEDPSCVVVVAKKVVE
ncbi:S-adenosyl-L-methionine-dependent methyltransferase [Cercophora scortea]|uniref:S-adenosyl-L-methionine-dependent methyltransferase n=1 Tax=Cercophora scortea TaxID=314031 RepID=A0AAE0M6B2_9PEZI|nr:S-adenosyl-L-methionine-dependent methyltransferase [Cercophora scortea]